MNIYCLNYVNFIYQSRQLSLIIWETPDFELHLPVSRFMAVISRFGTYLPFSRVMSLILPMLTICRCLYFPSLIYDLFSIVPGVVL